MKLQPKEKAETTQITIRIRSDSFEKIQASAEIAGVSMNEAISQILNSAIKKDKK